MLQRLLRKLFLENMGLKMIALMLALVMFLYVRLEQQRSAITGALVKTTFIAAPDKILTVDLPDHINVTISGSRRLIANLAQTRIPPVEINLAGFEGGTYRFMSNQIKLPKGLDIQSITPPEVDIRLEDKMVKEVPIVVNEPVGTPARGYRFEGIKVVPRVVKLAGAQSAVKAIGAIVLPQISIEDRTTSFEKQMVIQLKRKYIRASVASTRVSIKIVPEQLTRRYRNIPIQLLNVQSDRYAIRLVEKKADVTLEGPLLIFDQVRKDALKVVVALRQLFKRSGHYRVTPEVENIPKGLRVKTHPDRIMVVVKKKQTVLPPPKTPVPLQPVKLDPLKKSG